MIYFYVKKKYETTLCPPPPSILSSRMMIWTNLNLPYMMMLLHNFQIFWLVRFWEEHFQRFFFQFISLCKNSSPHSCPTLAYPRGSWFKILSTQHAYTHVLAFVANGVLRRRFWKDNNIVLIILNHLPLKEGVTSF